MPTTTTKKKSAAPKEVTKPKVPSPDLMELVKSLSNRLSKLEGDFKRLVTSHRFQF